MVKREQLLALTFYESRPFTGSSGPLRYRIEKVSDDDGKRLKVYAWKGEFAYDKTPEDDMTVNEFEFSDDGLGKITEWLNGL